jgi:hypothetical protein
MYTGLQITTINYNGIGEQAKARRYAAKLFDQVIGRATLSKIFGKLSGKDNRLRALSCQAIATSRTFRTVVVPLDKIVGTEGRSDDFDAKFRPLKQHNRDRWINLAAARYMGVVLPAVELVQDGDEYYVRDGHHRISVAKVMGQLEIDARVVN